MHVSVKICPYCNLWSTCLDLCTPSAANFILVCNVSAYIHEWCGHNGKVDQMLWYRWSFRMDIFNWVQNSSGKVGHWAEIRLFLSCWGVLPTCLHRPPYIVACHIGTRLVFSDVILCLFLAGSQERSLPASVPGTGFAAPLEAKSEEKWPTDIGCCFMNNDV